MQSFPQRRSAVRALFQRWITAREKRGTRAISAESSRLWRRVRHGLKPTVAALSLAAGGGLAIQVQAQTVTNLQTNGKTATTVTPTGNVYNVVTTSVAGSKAFNAFSTFTVGETSTVNLRLPNGTTHLINLVYGSAIQIDGVLNSLKSDNSIGGHIVFADPFGMVVGSKGVLNVGSLTAIAPTSTFMNGLLPGSSFAAPVDADVNKLIDGTAPIEPGSLIRINGRVNALAGVSLFADNVNVFGSIKAGADARHEATFTAAVNAQGLTAATGFVDAGGTIQIVASTEAKVTGIVDGADPAVRTSALLDASGKTGGTVSVKGATVTLGDNTVSATLTAAGTAGAGGTIEAIATNVLTVKGMLDASGTTNGGTVTVKGGSVLLGDDEVNAVVQATGGSGTGGLLNIRGTGDISVAGTLSASGGAGGGTVNVGWNGSEKATTVMIGSDTVIDANANTTGAGGSIAIWAQHDNQFHGSASATGKTTGGTVNLGGGSSAAVAAPAGSFADRIHVTGDIDVSGNTGGGTINIGSQSGTLANSVTVFKPATLVANANTTGNGGTINVWGNTGNNFAGTASATGGSTSGNGGTVTVSGRTGQKFAGTVDTTAAHGSLGTLTMVQDEMCIVVSVADAASCASTVLTSSLMGSSTVINVVADSRLRFGGSNGAALNLDLTDQVTGKTASFRGGNIAFNAGSTLSTNGGNLSLTATGGSIEMGNAQIFSEGGSVTLTATDAVNMGAGSTINTRAVSDHAVAATSTATTGTAGKVHIEATNINLGSGSSIYAQKSTTGTAFAGGAVELVAYEKADPLWNGVAKILDVNQANAKIELSGVIKAGTVDIGATALSIAGIVDDPDTANMQTSDKLAAKAGALFEGAPGMALSAIGGLLGVKTAAMVAESYSKVNVNGTANIESDGTMSIKSRAEQSAKAVVELGTMTVNPGGAQEKVAAAMVVGVTLGGSELNIRSGATLKSGGDMNLISRNDTTLVSNATVTSFGTTGGISLGVGVSNTSAKADVASGANITVTSGSLDFAAQQRGSYDVQGVAKAYGTGQVGIGAAVGVFTGNATAQMGGTVTANAGGINVEASNLVSKNFVKSSTTTGSSLVIRTLDTKVLSKVRAAQVAAKAPLKNALTGTLGALVAKMTGKLDEKKKEDPPAPPPSNVAVKVGSSSTVNVSTFSSDAEIKEAAVITAANGNFSLVSVTEDKGIHNIAASSVESTSKNDASAANPSNDVGLSAAVAVGLYEHNSKARVGNNATITAAKIGVRSETSQPLEITWLNGEWDSITGIYDALKPKISATGGVPEQVLSSFANATGGGGTLAVGGSVNFFDATNNATSWIGQGATLTATNADNNGFTEALHKEKKISDAGVLSSDLDDTRNATFDKNLTIDAVKFSEKASAAGNISITLAATGDGKAGVGGSFNYNGEGGTVAVVVDDNATLASSGGLQVKARSDDRLFVITPTTGRGTSIGGSLIAAYTGLDTNVVAAVSNQATVNANTVDVLASQAMNVWTAAGAFNSSKAAGVGVAVAVNHIGTNVKAIIGSTDEYRPLVGVSATGTDSLDAGATIATDVLSVKASSTGTSGVLAIAGAAVKQPPPAPPPPPGPPSPPPPPPPPPANPADGDGKASEGTDLTGGGASAAASKLGVSGIEGDVAPTSLLGRLSSVIASNLSLSGAKSAAANKYNSEQANQNAGSQKQTETPAPPPTYAFAAAGSLTVNLSEMDTTAAIDGATITGRGAGKTNTSVSAVNQTNFYSGSGAAALVKGGQASTQNVGIAGAVAVDVETNDTVARITNSTLRNANNTSVLAVSAGQHIAVGLGVALVSGTQPDQATAGAGNISVVVADNSTKAQLVGTTIGDSGSTTATTGDVNVVAYDSTDIGAGGIAIAASNGNAIGIGATVMVTTNDTKAEILDTDILRANNVTAAAFDPSRMIAAAVTVAASTGSKGVAAGGTVVATAIDNVTSATIGANGANRTTITSASGAVRAISSDSPTAEGFSTSAITGLLNINGVNAKDASFESDATNLTSSSVLTAKDEKGNVSDTVSTTTKGSLQIAAALQVSAGTQGAAVGFAAAGNGIGTKRDAVIDGAVISAASVGAKASDNSLQVAVAVGAAGSGNKFAGAGSIATNVNTTQTNARIGAATAGQPNNTTITTSGGAATTAVSVDAASNSQIWTLAGNIAISTGASAMGAAIVYNDGSASTSATIRDADINVDLSGKGKVDVKATTKSQINALAIAGGGSTNTSLQGAFAWNWIRPGQSTTATIDSSRISASALNVQAGDLGTTSSAIRGIAGALSISTGGTAIGGSIVVNTIDADRGALVQDSSITVGSGGATVASSNGAQIIGVGISAGGSSGVAAGVSAAVNTIHNTTSSEVKNTTLDSSADGAVSVTASSTSTIYGGVATAAISTGSIAVGGSVAANTVANTTEAVIDGASVIGRLGKAVGGVTVTATDASEIGFGILAVGGGGNAAVGAALGTNLITNSAVARVTDSALFVKATTGDVLVRAKNESNIYTGIASVAVGSDVGVGGIAGTNNVANTTRGTLEGTSVGAGSGNVADDVNVEAIDNSEIVNVSLAVGGSGTVAVGAAIAVNRVGNFVDAQLYGNTGQTVKINASDVTVKADSTSTISSAAAGVAASGQVGVGGSIAVNLVDTQVVATIDKNANVYADNNVAVLAGSNDKIVNAAGAVGVGVGAAGIGVSLSTNVITGKTEARVGGNDSNGKKTTVDALGKGTGVEVSNGLKLNGSDAGKMEGFAADDDVGLLAATVTTGTKTVKGLAVNALAVRRLASGAVSVGAGTVGVSATLQASAITGDTNATITNASINQGAYTAGTEQTVDVLASSHTHGLAVAGSVGLGLYAGVGAAFDGQGTGVNTRAKIENSQVKAAGAVSVDARASETVGQLDVGLGGGLVGVQGTGSIAIFRGVTEATLKGGATTAGSVLVHAKHSANFAINTGAAAAGAVGAAGAFNVTVNEHDVLAQIGEDAVGTGTQSRTTTVTTTGGDIAAVAESATNLQQWTASGAAGGVAGAITAGAGVMLDTATAKISRTAATSAARVRSESTVDTTVQQRGGAVSFGASDAVSGAVGIAIVRGQSAASIEYSTVSGTGVNVDALNRQDLDGISVGGAIGMTSGTAGSLQLNMVGMGAPGSGSEFTSAFTKTSGFANKDHLNDPALTGAIESRSAAPEDQQAYSASTVNSATRADFSGAMTTDNSNSTQARIIESTIKADAGSDTDRTKGVNVNAVSETAVRTIAGTVAGGSVGLAGSIGVTRVYNGVSATVDSGTTIGARVSTAAKPDVRVSALTRDKAGDWTIAAGSGPGQARQTVSTTVVAGGLGLLGGISVAIADTEINNTVLASVGSVDFNADAVTITARDESTATSDVYGVAAGGAGAAGVASSTMRRVGTIGAGATLGAYLLDPAVTLNANMRTLYVHASEAGSLSSNATAGSGGVGYAVSGNGADVTDNRTVQASIGSGSAIFADGTVDVLAVRQPKLSARTIGVAVAGVGGAGISVVTATLSGDTNATVGAETSLDGNGQYTIKASNLSPTDREQNVDAYALAAGGGLVVGAGGASATVLDSSNATASIGDDVYLPDSSIQVKADNSFNTRAFAASAGAGLVGLGVAVAKAEATGTATAELGKNVLSWAGRLGDIGAGTGGSMIEVLSGGVRTTRAYAFGGAGGLVAGAGSEATAKQRGGAVSRVLGYADGTNSNNVNAIHASGFNIVADQRAVVGAATDSFQASVLGAAASVTRTDVDVTSSAEVGDYVRVAARNVLVHATQSIVQDSPSMTFAGVQMFNDNAGSAGGGLAGGAGADSVSTLNSRATATVGKNVVMYALGNPIEDSTPATLKIGTGNFANVQDSVNINTGGGVSFPFARTLLNLNQYGTVTVGNDTVLNSAGTMDIATYTYSIASARSKVKVYGLAGLGRTEATTNVTTNETIAVGSNANLFSWDDMRIQTGKGVDPVNVSDHIVSSSADAYSGFVGLSDQSSTASFTENARILLGGLTTGTIGSGDRATLVSNRSITVGAEPASVLQQAVGSATSTLASAFSSSNSNNSSPTSSSSVMNLYANMTAGNRHTQNIVLDVNGNVVSAPSDVVITKVDAGVSGALNPYQALQAQIDALRLLPDTQPNRDQIDFLLLLQSNFSGGTVSSVNIGMTGTGVPATIANGVPSGAKFPLWASGGNINLRAGTYTGSGALTANGGATISITNPSAYYLNIGSITIPDVGIGGGGGAITVAGGNLPGAVTKTEVRKDVAPSITINSSYDPGPTGTAPWILVNGDINNLAGLVQLKSEFGSIGVFSALNAQSVDIQAPNGVVTLGSPGTNTFIGGNPETMWSGAEYLPSSDLGGISIGDYLAGFAAQLDAANAVGAATANGFNGHSFLGIYTGGNTGKNTSGRAIGWYRSNQGTLLDTSNREGAPCGSNNFLCIANANDWTYNTARSLRNGALNTNYNLGKTATLAQSSANASVGIRAGTMALIQGNYINVNAPIVAGRASNYSVTISNIAIPNWAWGIQTGGSTTLMDCMRNFSCLYSIASQGADGLWRIKGSYDDRKNEYTGLRSQYLPRASNNDAAVSVAYNANTGEWVTDAVKGGGGGLVWLKGKIASTNQSNLGGSITVNSGVSNVSVVNNTTAGLVLGAISPGLGGVGTIRITDDNFKSGGNSLNTWYVSVPGETVKKYSSYTASSWQTAGAGVEGATTYNPMAGLRYRWSREISVGRNVTENNGDNQPYQHWVISPWTVTSDWTSNTNVTRGFFVDTGDVGTEFRQDFTLASIHDAPLYYQGGQGGGTQVTYSYSYGDQNSSRTWSVPDRFTLRSTSSVKADHAIAIGFGGNSTGLVNVTSVGGINVNGNLANLFGTTSLTSTGGSLYTGYGKTVQSRNLALSSAGSITGGDNGAFQAVMGENGTFSAYAPNGPINVRLDGLSTTLKGTGIYSPNNKVTINANGSVFGQAGTGAQITARNIEMNSTLGGFGTLAIPLRIDARTTANGNAVANGLVTARAEQGIYLDKATGDMRIGTIASASGDVWLRAPGSLVAVPDLETQGRTDTEMAALWDKMVLTGSAASADATARNVTPYVQGVNMSYAEYWKVRGLGTYTAASGPTPAKIVLNTAGLNAMRGRTAVATGVVNPSDAQINAYASSRLGELEATFAGAMGSNWASQSQFAAYVPSYTYTMSTDMAAERTAGAVWNPNALVNVINASALLPSSAGAPIGPVTISGKAITLIASNDIGNMEAPMVIDVPTNDPSFQLNAAQKAALLRANARGDVTLEYADPATKLVLSKITVRQVRPLVVSSTQGFTVQAYDSTKLIRDLFIQTDAPINITEMSVTRDARILAGNGILTSTAPGHTSITVGRDLAIDGGAGGIGSAAIPLSVVVDNDKTDMQNGTAYLGSVIRASAGTDLYMSSPGQTDLRFGSIYAGGMGYVHAGGNLVPTGGGITMSVGSLDVAAGGYIGTAAAPLEFYIANGGTISAKAGTSVVLRSYTTGSGRIGNKVTMLDADGGTADLRSQTGGYFTIDGVAESTGNLVLITTGDVAYTSAGKTRAGGVVSIGGDSFLMDENSFIDAVSNVTITAYGSESLATGGGNIRLSSVTGNKVTANAFQGAITGIGNSLLNIRATGATGGVYLNQNNSSVPQYGKGIGTAGNALRVSGVNVNASTATGDVRLAVQGATNSQTLQAANGVVEVDSNAAMNLNNVIAGNGSVKLTSTSGDLVAQVVTATTRADIMASTGAARISSLVSPIGATVTGASVVLGATDASAGKLVVSATDAGGLGANLTNFSALTGATINSAAGMTLNTASVGNGVFQSTIGGAGNIGTITATGGDVKLNGASWTLGTLTAGGNYAIDIDALSGGIKYDALIAGKGIDLDATGLIKGTAGKLAQGSYFRAYGGSAQLGNIKSTTGAVYVQGIGGEATAGTITSAGAVTMIATGDVKATGLTGTVVDLRSDRNLTVTSGTANSFTGYAILDAQVGTLASGGALVLTSRDRSVGLTNGSAGTVATLTAGTSMNVGSLVATTGDISLTAPAGITLGTVTASGGGITMLATGTPSAAGEIKGQLVTSAKTARLTGTSLNFANGTVQTTGIGSDLYLKATGANGVVSYGKLDAVRDLFIEALGGVTGVGTANAMIAGRNIVASAAAFNGYRIKAPGTISLTIPSSGAISYTVVEGTLPGTPPPPTTTPPPPTTTPPPPTTTPPPPAPAPVVTPPVAAPPPGRR